MPSVAHFPDSASFPPLTSTLLDSAAALENHVIDIETRNQTLTRELQRAQQRQERARHMLASIRRSHRNKSHAFTTRLIKQALLDFDRLLKE